MASVLPLVPPRRLVNALERQPGQPAAPWLAALPDLLDHWLEHWRLRPERVVTPGGRTSLVVLVRQEDGAPAALKLPAPTPRQAGEATALRHWNGRSAVRLLRTGTTQDDPGGVQALLLERLYGEISLRALPEAKATLEAGSVARRLWVAPPEEGRLPTVAERTAQEERTVLRTAPEEVAPLVEEALAVRGALVTDGPEEVLLHGDFRQGAVLAADTERARWLAVGPEPVVGERAYDLARLVRDRLHDLAASPSAATLARRRVNRLARDLEVDEERLRGWSLYRAVESGARHHAAGQGADAELLWEFASWL